MAKIFKQLFGQGVKINVLSVNIKNSEARFIRQLGFWNSANSVFKRPKTKMIIYNLNKKFDSKLFDSEKWLIRYIDSDTIIS